MVSDAQFTCFLPPIAKILAMLLYMFMCTRIIIHTADAQTHHYNGMCTSSALMMVLEGSDAPEQHLLIADTLMQLKRNVCSVNIHTLLNSVVKHFHTKTCFSSAVAGYYVCDCIWYVYHTAQGTQPVATLLAHSHTRLFITYTDHIQRSVFPFPIPHVIGERKHFFLPLFRIEFPKL